MSNKNIIQDLKQIRTQMVDVFERIKKEPSQQSITFTRIHMNSAIGELNGAIYHAELEELKS